MTDQEIIEEAKEFLRLSSDADGENRRNALDDLQFGAGDQWPSAIAAQRTLENRPCLTINKTDSLVRQVTNNMRQQRPRMIVHPVADAEVEEAEIVQGALRHVEVNSGADTAYDTAADFQVRMGWGYWRVATRYMADDSFDQDMYIDAIQNPFTVYFDPTAEQPDGSDQEKCLITDMMKRKDYGRKYPDDSFSYQAAGDSSPDWANKDWIRIAEYWKVDRVPDKLIVLSNGWKGYRSDIDPKVLTQTGLTVVDERDSYKRIVRWYKITGTKILDRSVWRGKWIPIVPVYGATLRIEGKVVRYGMIRNLKDPARMYNFWRTSEAEIVALAPKAPWLIAEGQDEGHESEWDSANTKSYSRLVYKPKSFDDQSPVPPPMRQQPQQIPAASVNAASQAGEDMKAVAGIFDPSLGAGEQDPSGVALSRHQQQSDISNFHFYDNLTRSQRHTGKILLDLMPKIWDTQRVMRIIGEDGNPKTVTINEKVRDETGAIQKVLNDVTVGTFDIVMDTGPGYNTKRQETAESMVKLLGTPLGEGIAAHASDIVIRHFDWTGAKELADRMASVNPQAQEEMIPDLPAPAQAMVKGMQQQLQQMKQALDAKDMLLKNRADVEQMKQSAETNREHMRLTTKAHDIDEMTATKRHDTETRALSSQNVAEINAIAALLIKHIDGRHLQTEIDAQDRQLAAKSDQTEPA